MLSHVISILFYPYCTTTTPVPTAPVPQKTFHFRLIRIHSNAGNSINIKTRDLGKGTLARARFFAFLFTGRLFTTILEPGTGYHGPVLVNCVAPVEGLCRKPKYRENIIFVFFAYFFLSLLLPKGSVYCFKFKICCFLGEPGSSCINKKTLATNARAYFPTL